MRAGSPSGATQYVIPHCTDMIADALLYGFATAIPFAMLWPKSADVLKSLLN